MPMIPSLIALHLQEIFDIFRWFKRLMSINYDLFKNSAELVISILFFSRLASWNLGTGAYFDKQMMIHMQISLYALFLRLYGMYPCNFVAYLRSFYRDKNNPVFIHTIQVRINIVYESCDHISIFTFLANARNCQNASKTSHSFKR